MIERKRRGEKIHTSEAILNYQRSLLRGEHVEWTCAAGYKLFFVSAQGKFWICSMVHTNKHIMDVTQDDLYANYKKNPARKVAVFTALLVPHCWSKNQCVFSVRKFLPGQSVCLRS